MIRVISLKCMSAQNILSFNKLGPKMAAETLVTQCSPCISTEQSTANFTFFSQETLYQLSLLTLTGKDLKFIWASVGHQASREEKKHTG